MWQLTIVEKSSDIIHRKISIRVCKKDCLLSSLVYHHYPVIMGKKTKKVSLAKKHKQHSVFLSQKIAILQKLKKSHFWFLWKFREIWQFFSSRKILEKNLLTFWLSYDFFLVFILHTMQLLSLPFFPIQSLVIRIQNSSKNWLDTHHAMCPCWTPLLFYLKSRRKASFYLTKNDGTWR